MAWDPHGRGTGPSPATCALTSIPTPCCTCVPKKVGVEKVSLHVHQKLSSAGERNHPSFIGCCVFLFAACVNLLSNSHTEFTRICLTWKTDTWLWLRIFLTDMIIYQVLWPAFSAACLCRVGLLQAVLASELCCAPLPSHTLEYSVVEITVHFHPQVSHFPEDFWCVQSWSCSSLCIEARTHTAVFISILLPVKDSINTSQFS